MIETIFVPKEGVNPLTCTVVLSVSNTKALRPTTGGVCVGIEVCPGIWRVIRRYGAHNLLREEVRGSVAAFLMVGREDWGFEDELAGQGRLLLVLDCNQFLCHQFEVSDEQYKSQNMGG